MRSELRQAAADSLRILQAAVLEWVDPLFPGGHWTPQLVGLAGAEHPINPCRSATAAALSAKQSLLPVLLRSNLGLQRARRGRTAILRHEPRGPCAG